MLLTAAKRHVMYSVLIYDTKHLLTNFRQNTRLYKTFAKTHRFCAPHAHDQSLGNNTQMVQLREELSGRIIA
jgi:hypothetical protein